MLLMQQMNECLVVQLHKHGPSGRMAGREGNSNCVTGSAARRITQGYSTYLVLPTVLHVTNRLPPNLTDFAHVARKRDKRRGRTT
jgi:hypothetical protein